MIPADRVEAALDIPRGHPAFEGHFPGRPILPGVVLLCEALAAIESATGRAPQQWTLEQCKFVQAVPPGVPLRLAHRASASGVAFEIHAGGELAVSGTLKPRE